MKIALTLVMLSAIGCATKPSLYGAKEKEFGYTDKTIDNNLRVADFKGNSATKKETAELYAKFRAIQVCTGVSKPYTHILFVRDKTYTDNVTQTAAVGPGYYYGMSPYYGTGMGATAYSVPTRNWNESYTYPMFDVYFECVDKPMDARVSLKKLSASQVDSIIKDLKGAVQVDKVLSDSPNKESLKSGDIITKAGGDRVETVVEVYQASRKSNPDKFKVEFYRDGVKKETIVKFKDVTNLVDDAQKEILKQACDNKEIKQDEKICKG